MPLPLSGVEGANMEQTQELHQLLLLLYKKVKASHTRHRIPSVGPRDDPGVQAASPQVTISHSPGGRLPLLSTRPAGYLPSSSASPHHGQYQVILLGVRGT